MNDGYEEREGGGEKSAKAPSLHLAATTDLTFQLGAHLVGSLLDISCEVLQFLLGLCKQNTKKRWSESRLERQLNRLPSFWVDVASPPPTGSGETSLHVFGACPSRAAGIRAQAHIEPCLSTHKPTLCPVVWPHSLSSGLGAAKMALCCFFTSSTSSESFSMQPRISSTCVRIHRDTDWIALILQLQGESINAT